MLDSNGSNTTAVAAVAKLRQAAGTLDGRAAVVTAGSGPVGLRAAGLLAKAGARVTVTSRRAADGSLAGKITQRFGGSIREVTMADSSGAAQALEGAEMFLNAGPAGVCLIPRSAWVGRAGLHVAGDVNAVPPLGVEGIEVTDDGATREGVTTFGALGIGGQKMKIHKACIAKLFEKNDLVLDAESIAELADTL
jgi:NAD(P)-dependent dehydrogenase (short-subunit alcohol dehydrogenase family)